MTLADAIESLQQEHMAMTKEQCGDPARWGALEKKYLHWLNRYPDRPELLFQLGTYYLQQDKRGLAIALFERSVTCGALGAGVESPPKAAEDRRSPKAGCVREPRDWGTWD